MITIQGLNKQQRALADVVWAMDSIESVLAFRNTLRGQQQRDLDTVLMMLAWAVIDQTVEDSEDYDLACEVLSRYRLG